MIAFFIVFEIFAKLPCPNSMSITERQRNNDSTMGMISDNSNWIILNKTEKPMLCIPAVAALPQSAVITVAEDEKILMKVETSFMYNINCFK